MYRPSRRNKNGANEVRGPNSALTQFLREQGISAEAIKQRWESTKQNEVAEADEETKTSDDEFIESVSNTDEVISEKDAPKSGSDYDSETESDNEVTTRRRRVLRSAQDDSDEEEYGSDTPSGKIDGPSKAKDNAAELQKRKITLQQRKRKKRKAAALLDKKTQKIPLLQDLCILAICHRIMKYSQDSNNVDRHIRAVLGGISIDNLNKLAAVLSKNRALNDNTLQLFLHTELLELTFHDCSKISFDAYKQLAVFTPHLTKLSLQMCGQLNNEAILFIADKLPKLEEIYLDGPFLIDECTWIAFFQKMRNRLKAFHISNTHRFNDAALESLLQNSGETLESIQLSRLDALSAYGLLTQYLRNENFHTLILQYPADEKHVSDEIIIKLLGSLGSNLKVLKLDGCTDLTDSVLTDGLTPFLRYGDKPSFLETLSLEELDQITSDGFLYFVSSVALPNLRNLSLCRCLQLDDSSIVELWINECAKSLVYLNLNSLKQLTSMVFTLMQCPNLKQLNLGFVRCVNDDAIKVIVEQNPALEIIEVYGNNSITSKATVKEGTILVGRQCDSI
ncbi:HFL262Wp [Eremothecium sinecaudum]|uniref:HFL262Wp n=1 Tax=Eremothecium sinecaudum TaxID=45286 RepID=A0A0X8HUD4_9SACH|nr:HFL262Wp [Eremothecium sinecaudum]AMD21594.1 HFL262Wp [Eremothecium sinecaudum]